MPTLIDAFRRYLLLVIVVTFAITMGRCVDAQRGEFTLNLLDTETNLPVASRVRVLRSSTSTQSRKSNPRLVYPRSVVRNGNGFVLPQSLQMRLSAGMYPFEIIRGPEYQTWSGHFIMDRDSLDEKTVEMKRMVNMRSHGWISGDVCVPPDRPWLPMQMLGEDLHVAAVIRPRQESPKRIPPPPVDVLQTLRMAPPSAIRTDGFYDPAAGGLFVLGGEPSKTLSQSDLVPCDLIAAKTPTQKIIIDNPFHHALPVWIASERIDAFMLMGDWLRLDTLPAAAVTDRLLARFDSARPPSEVGYLGADGPGRWVEQIYWRLLDCGLQLPPVAGSGTGSAAHPVGYNRTYALMPPYSVDPDPRKPFVDADAYWQSVFAGQTVVTNGPLLRVTLDDQPPGVVFEGSTGETLSLSVRVDLNTRDPVDYLDVIHNGAVAYSTRLQELAANGGEIPLFQFKESGWVLVRVVTQYEGHWRAAVSAPWYIQFDDQPRIASDAVQFFQDWLKDHESRLRKLPADKLKKHIPYIRSARAHWKDLERRANQD